MSNTVYIIDKTGAYRKAECLAKRGDWAVTKYIGVVKITHLPTGACVPAAGTELQLQAALPALARLPRVDLQRWDDVAGSVKAVLSKRGLLPATRKAG